MTGDDLAEIERLAGALLRSLSAGQRRKLLRKMARDLAASQRQRIAAQRQPDGSAFVPRKQKEPPVTGRGRPAFSTPPGAADRHAGSS
jgi:phage virion morphogenesis protein